MHNHLRDMQRINTTQWWMLLAAICMKVLIPRHNVILLLRVVVLWSSLHSPRLTTGKWKLWDHALAAHASSPMVFGTKSKAYFHSEFITIVSSCRTWLFSSYACVYEMCLVVNHIFRTDPKLFHMIPCPSRRIHQSCPRNLETRNRDKKPRLFIQVTLVLDYAEKRDRIESMVIEQINQEDSQSNHWKREPKKAFWKSTKICLHSSAEVLVHYYMH